MFFDFIARGVREGLNFVFFRFLSLESNTRRAFEMLDATICAAQNVFLLLLFCS